MTASWEARADLVIVGSGVAGLTAASEAARLGLRVVVLAKAAADDTNTRWAQGGVAVVLPTERDAGDTTRRHVNDTMTAGAGLCDSSAVRTIVGDGPDAVTALRRSGAVFDNAMHGRLARTREGGHSARRVVHAGGDATGAEVERALLASVRNWGPTLLEGHTAVDVVRTELGVCGLLVLDGDGRCGLLRTPAVLLATGGLGQLYRATSNPEVATGDGIALALRAGAAVADLEFVQFHPTVLYTGPDSRGRRPLVTEAVRGEGAVLVDAGGTRVMTGVHPMEDLAPRDVVSAAIARRLADSPAGVDDHVFLDARHLPVDKFRTRFPTVFGACVEAGIEPSRTPIPVAPAAHFACGGVVTTIDGRTEVPGLYAAGEVARTGMHGANRLASNSLLEGLVVGTRAARAVATDRRRRQDVVDTPELPSLPVADRRLLQDAMSRHAAIGRDAEGLNRAAAPAQCRTVRTRNDVEDAAMTLVARALVVAALERTETRGCHVRTDHEATAGHLRRSTTVRLDHAGTPVLAGALALEGAA